MSTASLFVRKASGLVRAWSVFDAFIYATFSINLITLGLFIFSYCFYLGGSLATGVVIGAAFTIFEVIVYASLISAMPRAGGDYVWQSRILNRGLGFILAVTGWWFILWLWTPLYGQMLAYEVYTPLLAIVGLKDAAIWFTTSQGLLVAMLSVCLIVFIYIAIGMRWYARIQKFCFWGGMAGLVMVALLLLFGNNATFIANFNEMAPKFGAQGGDVYAATLAAGEAAKRPLRRGVKSPWKREDPQGTRGCARWGSMTWVQGAETAPDCGQWCSTGSIDRRVRRAQARAERFADCFLGGGQGQMRETVGAAGLTMIHDRARIEVLDFAGKTHVHVRCIIVGNRPGARAPLRQARPSGGHIQSQGGYGS